MKENQIHRFRVNKDMFFDAIYDGESISLVSPGNIKEDQIMFEVMDDIVYILIGKLPYVFIDTKTGNIVYEETIPTTMIRNSGQLKEAKEKKDYLKNFQTYFESLNNKSDSKDNLLELHTHFMEVLSGEEFFDLVKDKVKYISFNENDELVSSYPYDENRPTNIKMGPKTYSIDEVLNNQDLYNKVVKDLSIDSSKQVQFEEISKVLHRRTALIELVSYYKAISQVKFSEENRQHNWKKAIDELRSQIRRDFYFDMLVASLKSLSKQGVKYVEFSYSTAGSITSLIDRFRNYKIDEDISFNFLYSVHRTKRLSSFKKDCVGSNSKSRKECLESVLPILIECGVTGFDLMGMESEITRNDYYPSINDINGTLYDKLYTVIKILTMYEDKKLTLRLHAGEVFYDTNLDTSIIIDERNNNPQKTLEIVDIVINDLNLERKKQGMKDLIPPNIRIGHGLHFKKSQKYIDLLKKYNVIVEINASSNFALSNINNLKDIPYNWYLENDIPVVLSTDGGGFYLTTPTTEMELAEIFGKKKVVGEVMKTNQDLLPKFKGGTR